MRALNQAFPLMMGKTISMYEKAYYDDRKKELQAEYQAIVNDTYQEIERLVAKKVTKQNELTAKLKETEKKEEESKKELKATCPEPENKMVESNEKMAN